MLHGKRKMHRFYNGCITAQKWGKMKHSIQYFKKMIAGGVLAGTMMLSFSGCMKTIAPKESSLDESTGVDTNVRKEEESCSEESRETSQNVEEEASSELPENSEKETFSEPEESDLESTEDSSEEALYSSQESETNPVSVIHAEGMSLATRFTAPEGYTKAEAGEQTFLAFMRNMELKPEGSPILLYDGTVESEQHDAAVFALDVGTRNLQQCADSVIRVYSEYLWSIGAYDQIGFHLTNGFWMDYASWRAGNRLALNGNETEWVLSETYDDSYECFRKYLTQVFVYAGTASLDRDCEEISMAEAMPGDLILKGGSPGHCILIVDMAVNAEGKKCFLLAEGHMPAEDFHVMLNERHPENPWFYEEEITYPFETPRFVFPEGSLQRYFPELPKM